MSDECDYICCALENKVSRKLDSLEKLRRKLTYVLKYPHLNSFH